MQLVRNKEVISVKLSNEPTNQLRSSIVEYLLEELKYLADQAIPCFMKSEGLLLCSQKATLDV